jgi:hypothetical protein
MPFRQEVLDNRLFWALVFGAGFGQIGEPPEMEAICSLLGVDPDAVEEWSNQLTGWYPGIFDDSDGCVQDPSAVRVPLAGGVDLTVEFHPGDCYWMLTDDREPSPAALANVGPHWALPGLRWQEAVAASDAIDRSSGDGAIALLLLLPVVWLTNSDDVDSARRTVANAWSGSGHVRGSGAPLLADLWVRAVRGGHKYCWWVAPGLGWVTDAHWSSRGVQRSPGEVQRINRLVSAACPG